MIPYNTDAPLYHMPIATVGLIVLNTILFFAVPASMVSFEPALPSLILDALEDEAMQDGLPQDEFAQQADGVDDELTPEERRCDGRGIAIGFGKRFWSDAFGSSMVTALSPGSG